MLPDDPPGIEEFREIAAHEAAHALLAAASGVPSTRVLVVQLDGFQKLNHIQLEGEKKDDCSHCGFDKDLYDAARPIVRCAISRAGEVGQRLHTESSEVMPIDNWSDDHKKIACESKFTGDELDALIGKLGAVVEQWLKGADADRIWKRLIDALDERKKERYNDDRFYSEIEGEDLRELLQGVPPLPEESMPLLPERQGGEANPKCCTDA
jgi:hypothetical protein